mgnify:FL=1
MVKGLGRKMNVYTAPQKAKEATKTVKNVATKLTQPNKLTQPLQGGITAVGRESNYSNYLDLMA